MDTGNNFSREEIQDHWNDTDWLLKHGIVTRRPASDWRPIEDCIPDVGECWLTIELANGQKYVVKSAIDAKVIANGINRNYPCVIAWMPCEIPPEPYEGEATKKKKEKKNKISFFVAECAEFPDMGECHRNVLDLETAFRLYDAIPSERMHAGKCIGFDLMNGDDIEGEYILMSGGKIEDWLLDDRYLKTIPEVQEIIQECLNILTERKKSRN